MADLRYNGLSFDRGIEQIVHTQDVSVTTLPDHQDLTPAELNSRPQLEQLLAMPNLADYLENHLRPELLNKDILSPTRFRQALDSALKMLRDAAEQDPSSAKQLNRAARLLGEEADLRDLLQMYRSALYQG